MSILLFSDIHLNTKLEDEYRWGLLPWIEEQIQNYNIKHLICLGDLTDAKDRHSAVLVNRFADQVFNLSVECPIFIRGNHDSIDPEWPFFQFLEHNRKSWFITELEYAQIGKWKCVLLPAVKNPPDDWKFKSNDFIGFKDDDFIFCHQTFQGVTTDTGFPIPGVDPKIFGKTKAKVWSGDIHIPLVIPATEHSPEIEHVGAPYRTNYGDTYTPRVVLINDNGSVQDLHYPCPTKLLFEISGAGSFDQWNWLDYKAGDWIKVRVKLKRADYPEWPRIKDAIILHVNEIGCHLHGQPELVALTDDRPRLKTAVDTVHQTPEELVREYSQQQNLDKATEEFGLSLIRKCPT